MARAVTGRSRRHPLHTRQSAIHDTWGDRWLVGERRPTQYGFALYLGWPYINGRLKKQGKAMFILTGPLARHMRRHAQRPHFLPLPIGRKALRRLRQQLGVDHRSWTDMRLYWWIDRIDDLATLSATQFVAKHQAKAWTRSGTISITLVWGMRAILIGPGLINPTGQYRKLRRS
jgi:hypothetical protein